MATLGSVLKGLGQILLLPFLLPAIWNGDTMAGTQAPILGLEDKSHVPEWKGSKIEDLVLHPFEALCQPQTACLQTSLQSR